MLMTTVQKIAYNTGVQIIGKAITIAIALVGFGLMTRYLGQKDFGYFSTIYAYLTIFGILVDLGLQMTTTKLISDPQENENQILNNVLSLRLITSLMFLVLAFFVALFLPYPILVKIGIAIAVFGYTASALTTVLTSFFQKHLIIHQAVIAEVGGQTIYLILMILAINLNTGLIGVLVASILNSVFIFIFSIYFIRRQLKITLGFDGKVWLKILKNTWPLGLTIALNLIYFKGGFFLGVPLMILMSGADFAVSGEIIKILFIATGTIFIAGLFGYTIVALGEQKKMIKFYAINAMISIIGYIIFISRYGYWGAAWMTVATESFILLTVAYVMYQKLKFLPNLKIFAKAISASLVMAIPLYFLTLPFFVSILLGAIVYFITLYLIKGIDRNLILELVGVKNNEKLNH